MLRSEFKYFDNVLALIEVFEKSKTTVALVDCIKVAAGTYGYDYLLITSAPSIARNEFEQRVLLRHWPEQWFKEYVHQKFNQFDPVASYGRTQCTAFQWINVPWDRSSELATKVMSVAAQDYGMRNGLCVPIHGMHGYEGMVSFSGSDIDRTDQGVAAMELLAIYAVNQLMRLRTADQTPQYILTLREREVLTWAAIGKTAWDTGCILSISTDTVNKHMASAMRKLKAYTKTQAVAESIRRGEIRL
ncbi:MAG: autoinducer binding domain-containing protein [Afipia sp.]|nr:autoinducer binding domain-containing protein [Afipia sp.]